MISLVQHVSDLVDIIMSPELPKENPSKDFASIYLKTYLSKTLGSKEGGLKVKAGIQTILSEDLGQCAKLFVKAIVSKTLTTQRNIHVQLALELVLLASQRIDAQLIKAQQSPNNLGKQVFEYVHSSFMQPNVDQNLLNEILSVVTAICLSCQNFDDLLLFI